MFDEFKHEYMHQIQNAFGFPLSSVNHVESSASYGIMDGTYLGNGHYMDGWMLRMLGWLDPIEVDSTVAGGDTTITLAAVPNPGSRVLVRTVDPKQHFMLELRNRDLPYAQGHGVGQCGSEAGFSGLLITHVLDEGGSAKWGAGTGFAPFFDPEVATGRFDGQGAPDPVQGEDLIQDQEDCWFTARDGDLFKTGNVNVFGPFTNPNTSLHERPVGFTSYTAPSTLYSGITIYGMEWVAGDDSMRVRIRFDGSAPPAGADTIRADMTWDGLVQLTGDLVVAPGANVTVTDSSRVIFKARDDRHSDGKDEDRVELITRGGRLAVQGTASARARFTSSRDDAFINFRTAGETTDAAPGDYYGLRFLDTNPSQPLSLLDHTSFSYPRFAVEVDSISGDLWHCQFSHAESADVFVGRDHRVSEYYRWFLDAPTRVMVKESDPYGTGSDSLRVEMEFNGQFYTERPAGVSSQDSVWFVSAAATPTPGDWAGIKAQDVYARAGVKDASIGHAVDPLSYSGIIYTAEVENSRFHHYSNIGFFDYWSRAIVRGCSFDGSGSSDFEEGADTGIKAVFSIPTIENNTVSWHKSHGIKLEWAKVACKNMDDDPNAVEDSSFVQGNVLTGNGEDSATFTEGSGIGVIWGCVKRHVRIVANEITGWPKEGVSLFQCAETRLACNVIEDNFRGVQHSRNISEASGQVVRLRANELRSSLDTNLWADDAVKLRLYDSASPNYAKQNAFRPDSLGASEVKFNIDHADPSLAVLDARGTVWWSASGTLLDVSDSTYVRNRIRGNQIKVDITSPQDPLELCEESANVAGLQRDARFDEGGIAKVTTETSGEALALAIQPRTAEGSEFALNAPSGASQGVRLLIYDVRGRLVASVLNGGRPGRQTATWDERDLSGQLVASGVYFVRLEAGKTSINRKLVVVR